MRIPGKIRDAAYQLLLQNRCQVGEHQYTAPSRRMYPYQWLWDSCFHAIILSHFSCDDAKREIESLLSKQLETGLIPHIIFWESDRALKWGREKRGDAINSKWGRDDTSSITQPPMLAYAVWHIFSLDGDRSFLERVYQSLSAYYKHLLTQRDPRQNHLIGIINPDESGEDNSPRFDIPLGLSPWHTALDSLEKRMELMDHNKACNFDAPYCMKKLFWVKDVPFNAIIIRNLQALADIARELGNTKDAKFFEQESAQIRRAIRRHMCDGIHAWSLYSPNYTVLRIKTWAIFAPLFAHVFEPEEAHTLVKKYLLNSKEFRTKFLLPTVAQSEDVYTTDDFWRGPIWMAPNWFIYHGLREYGLETPAREIFLDSVALIEQSGFREYYNPETGTGYGAQHFTWGGLVIDMAARK